MPKGLYFQALVLIAGSQSQEPPRRPDSQPSALQSLPGAKAGVARSLQEALPAKTNAPKLGVVSGPTIIDRDPGFIREKTNKL